MNSVYFPSGVHQKYERDFGCAVLSPWPLEEPRKLVLPHAARVQRSAAVGHLGRRRARGASASACYSVHLPSPLAISGGSRREQLARSRRGRGRRRNGPVVIVGRLRLARQGRGARPGPASPGDARRRRARRASASSASAWLGSSYDHVLAEGCGVAGRGRRRDRRGRTAGASDHRPIWAVLVPARRPGPGRSALDGLAAGGERARPEATMRHRASFSPLVLSAPAAAADRAIPSPEHPRPTSSGRSG